MPKIDLGTTSPEKPGKRIVRVPEKDLFDQPFPTVRINLQAFEAGNDYWLEDAIADAVEERIRTRQGEDIRVMRPQQDVTSQNIMNRYGVGARAGGKSVNPDAMGA